MKSEIHELVQKFKEKMYVGIQDSDVQNIKNDSNLLRQVISSLGIRVKIMSPPPDVKQKVDEMRYNAKGDPDLIRVMYNRMKRGAYSVPSPSWFVHNLRRSWYNFSKNLYENQQVFEYVTQILCLPFPVRKQTLEKCAVTYSAANDVIMPNRCYPLRFIRMVEVSHRYDTVGALVPACVSYCLGVNNNTLTYKPHRFFKLNLPPTTTPKHAGQLKTSSRGYIRSIIAAHQALELEAVTGVGLQTEVEMPWLLVATTKPEELATAARLELPHQAVVDKAVEYANACVRMSLEAVRNYYQDKLGNRPYGFLWLDFLKDENVVLTNPVRNINGIAQQLGAKTEDFIFGVWLSFWEKSPGRENELVAPAFIVPDFDGDASHYRLFFPERLLGRDEYWGGQSVVNYNATRPQVINRGTIANEPFWF